MSENPFQSPMIASQADVVEPAIVGNQLKIASSNRRLCNMLLDVFFYWIIMFIAGMALALLGLIQIVESTAGNLLFTYGIMIAYFVVQEGAWGQTLGKRITGTMVVDQDGGKPTFGQVVGRTLCRFIPFEPFSFLGKNPVGWHDKIPKTRVVMTR